MPTSSEIEAQLTGPGAPFEVVTDVVNGVTVKVFKERPRSLREIASSARERGDDETFVVYRDRRVSFASFVAQANVISHALVERFGIGQRDRIAVLSANNLEWCLAFWATVDLGCVLVGLNGWWKTDEILFGLEDSGARVLIADRARFARLSGQLGSLENIEAIFVIDADAGIGGDPRVRPFDDLLATGSHPPPIPDLPIGEDDPAVIFYTSGTTGRPKGAVSTHRSMIANLQNTMYVVVAGLMAPPARDQSGPVAGPMVALLTSPLFHVSGCHSGLVVALAAGIKLVIPDGKFEPEKAMRLIEEERVTTWATVPTMVWRVVEHPARHYFDMSSVTTISYGGSPSAAELQRRVHETFPNVSSLANAYGLTESSSVVTVNTGPDMEAKPDSVGRPVPLVDVRIVDHDGKDVPTGRTGEVWIKGPIIMPGYWNNPEATAEVLTDGWLRSGDVGYLDGEGYLYITDRAKDMIIRGGENIYCVEIENRLVEHPAIAEAAVIGVPHPTLGEEVKAVVRPEPGAVITEREVKDWVSETLADFKVPAYVDITHELLPRNASGKLLKNVLRGQAEATFAETM